MASNTKVKPGEAVKPAVVHVKPVKEDLSSLSDGGPGLCCLRSGSLLLGLGAAAILIRALTFGQAFDATVSAFLLVLCCWVFRLQGERMQLRRRLGPLPKVLARRQAGASAEPAAPEATRTDMAGHARMLGLSLRMGISGMIGDNSMNKILMTSLAKEHLRCVTALRCYQATFGILPEEVPPSAAQPAITAPLPSSDACPLDMSQRSNFAAELVFEFPASPRSPSGPRRGRGLPAPTNDPAATFGAMTPTMASSAVALHGPAGVAPAITEEQVRGLFGT